MHKTCNDRIDQIQSFSSRCILISLQNCIHSQLLMHSYLARACPGIFQVYAVIDKAGVATFLLSCPPFKFRLSAEGTWRRICLCKAGNIDHKLFEMACHWSKSSHHSLHFLNPERRVKERCRNPIFLQTTWINERLLWNFCPVTPKINCIPQI